jgi:hypothetical protein
MGEISKYAASELFVESMLSRADKSDMIKMVQNGMGAKATIKNLLPGSLIIYY